MLTSLRAKSKMTLPQSLVDKLGFPVDNNEILVFGEEAEEERIARQLKALDEFRDGLSVSEPLGPEFDEIIARRVNITGNVDL